MIKQTEKYVKLFWALLIVFLICLIVISQFHEMGGFNVETDFYGGYAINLEKVLHGGRFQDEDHGPGYIFVLIVFYFIFGDAFTAGKFLTIFSSVLFAAFTFLSIKNIFNSKLAFYTIVFLLIIIFPFSILVSTDMFFAFLIAFSTYLIFKNGKISYSNLLWGGLVAGYAVMTRLNAIILPAAIIFSLIIINPGNWHWKKRGVASLILLGSMILAASPWFIMNISYYGKPFISEAHQTIGASFLMSKQDPNVDFSWGAEKAEVAQQYDSMFSLISNNFTAFVKFFLKNVIQYFKWLLIFLIKFPGYLFVAPGALLLFSKANKLQLSYFTIPLCGFLIYCIVAFIPRFYIYIVAFFILFIIYFLFYENFPAHQNSFSTRFFYFSRIIFTIVLLLTAKESISELRKNISNEPIYIKKIATFLQKQSLSTDKIIARKPHLGYFSKLESIVFPDVSTVNDILIYARENNARYLYYGTTEFELRPKLRIFQRPENLPSNFELLYYQDKPKVFLYKIILE